jgi:hypothetical protein
VAKPVLNSSSSSSPPPHPLTITQVTGLLLTLHPIEKIKKKRKRRKIKKKNRTKFWGKEI